MFIELSTPNHKGSRNLQVFIKTDDISRILETPEGTKLVFSNGESLLVLEPAVDIYHELKQLEDNSDPTGGLWP